MVAETPEVVVVKQSQNQSQSESVPVLDVRLFTTKATTTQVDDVRRVSVSDDSVSPTLSTSQTDMRSGVRVSDVAFGSPIPNFVPRIRSGSFADIGPRECMEDEHICIDDLCTQFGSLLKFPMPSAFYGVFDGHGGPEAAAYIRKSAMKFFFEEANFPQTSEVNNIFLEDVKDSLRKAFLRADLALAEDLSASRSSGTTALTAFVFERFLIVANAGDCRAVLCRNGEALDMSRDHKPIDPSERQRVQKLGGQIDDGYLNGELSVSRALGDWDLKLLWGSPSPLIAEPDFQQVVLTEGDEFLIIGCDGIWDVMSSKHAVNVVRLGLRRHGDPSQCARDVVKEALRLNTGDNLTVIIVCFSSPDYQEPSPPRQRKQRCCSLSPEAMRSLRNLLEGASNH